MSIAAGIAIVAIWIWPGCATIIGCADTTCIGAINIGCAGTTCAPAGGALNCICAGTGMGACASGAVALPLPPASSLKMYWRESPAGTSMATFLPGSTPPSTRPGLRRGPMVPLLKMSQPARVQTWQACTWTGVRACVGGWVKGGA